MYSGLGNLVINYCVFWGMVEVVGERGKKGIWWSLIKKFFVKFERLER